MKQHIDIITRLLLGAAYADKRLEGAEVTRIEQILRAVVGGEPDPEQMELLRGRVHRMEALIDGILQYSRAGRVKAKQAPPRAQNAEAS